MQACAPRDLAIAPPAIIGSCHQARAMTVMQKKRSREAMKSRVAESVVPAARSDDRAIRHHRIVSPGEGQ
jgi:hypothetical protein